MVLSRGMSTNGNGHSRRTIEIPSLPVNPYDPERKSTRPGPVVVQMPSGEHEDLIGLPDCEPVSLESGGWDTSNHEKTYLAAAIEYFGPFGRSEDKLLRLLSCGIDETWFTDRYRRYLYLGVFSAATKLNQGATVKRKAIIDESERLSGETGWVLDEIQKVNDSIGVFKLDEFLSTEVKIWWQKLKRPKVRKAIGVIDKLLSYEVLNEARTKEIENLASELLQVWREEPVNSTKLEKIHEKVRNDCLKPIPEDYSIDLGLGVYDEMLNGGIGGHESPDAGRLIVLCARPGAGKSLVAGNIAMRVAARGYKAVFWSFEMGKEELAMRNIATKDYFHCRRLGRDDFITYDQLKGRRYTMEQRERLKNEDYSVIDENLHIFLGNGGMTAEYLADQMKVFARLHPETRLFVVDHLGLLNISSTNRAVAVGEATRILKTAAREMHIDILLLCQLNRAVEGREDKKPTLSDLRDSGRIEEDSDIVMGLYRPAYYVKDDPSIANILETISLKNRQGKSNTSKECIIHLDSCAILDPGSTAGLGDEIGL